MHPGPGDGQDRKGKWTVLQLQEVWWPQWPLAHVNRVDLE